MNTQSKVTVGGVILAIIMAFVALTHGGTVGPAGKDGESFGSVSGPDVQFQDMTFNGIPHRFVQTGFITASSTICAMKSPSVDSRLEHVSVRFATLPSYATSFMVGSGTINATTTSIIANIQLSYAASATNQTSVGSSTSSVLIPANTFVNVNYSTSTSANVASSGFAPTGRCEAEFVSI